MTSSNTPRPIELLAPAKNAEIGIAAIDHGADAVYIGAPQFSARSAAGNTIADIERLVAHAHLYGARVYVALNTLLSDDELPTAQRIIHELYQVGVDALIVQDMGILQLDLPPIALHASTQTDNRTPQKVRFMQDAGCSQVVLARELSLQQIRAIADHTDVPLEAFVHGALCVSYSGQCYLSQHLSGRSANRGACAQYCRLPYTLEDATGAVIAQQQHLLSLKDLNLSDRLEELLDAGVSSLKIEGRLKDISYVKNVTAYYRQRLDAILDRRADSYTRSSYGRCNYNFTPDTNESFNRGFTHFYLDGRTEKTVISPRTPKSMGRLVGRVKRLDAKSIETSRNFELNNGDGLVFFNTKGELEGFRVNRVEGSKIYPASMPSLTVGTELYRNYNHAFESALAKPTAERRIALALELHEQSSGYLLRATDEAGITTKVQIEAPIEAAKTPQQENQQRQLSRLGGTPFVAEKITLHLNGERFIPSSTLAELRRQLVEQLHALRLESHQREVRKEPLPDNPYPTPTLTYLGNVMNSQARSFYTQHGVAPYIAPAYEQEQPQEAVPLMFSKHCLRYHIGCCTKQNKGKMKWQEPLYLTYKETRLRLAFDCAKCEMQVYHEPMQGMPKVK